MKYYYLVADDLRNNSNTFHLRINTLDYNIPEEEFKKCLKKINYTVISKVPKLSLKYDARLFEDIYSIYAFYDCYGENNEIKIKYNNFCLITENIFKLLLDIWWEKTNIFNKYLIQYAKMNYKKDMLKAQIMEIIK